MEFVKTFIRLEECTLQGMIMIFFNSPMLTKAAFI